MSEGKAKRKRAENLLGSFMEKRRGVSVAGSLKYIFIGLFLASVLILLVVELVSLSAGYVSLSHFAVEVCLLTVIGAAVFLTAYLTVRRAVAYPLAVEENTMAGSASMIDAIDNLKLAKRVARILRESEETLRTVFDCSGDAIFIHDLDGTFLEVNRVACDRLGYSREELLKLTPMDIDTMEYAEMAPGRIKQIKKKGSLTFETAHVARDGRVIPTEISSRMLGYKGQECVISTCRDITERKAAEEALRDDEERYRTLAENINDVVFMADLDLNLTYVSPSVERQTGFTVDEAVGRNVVDFITAESLSHVYEVLEFELARQADTIGQPPVPELLEVEQYRKDGTTFPAGTSVAFLRGPGGTPYGVLGVLRDVTERKAAEQTLRESEEKLVSAQEVGRIGSWEYDIDSKKIEWSLETYRLYERDLALGPPTEEEEAVYYTDEQSSILREYARRAIEEEREFRYDLEARLPTGRRVLFTATMQPVKDDGGRVTRLWGTVHDITERKEAEEALRKSEEMLRSVFNASPLVMEVFDKEGRLVSVNKTALKVFGVPDPGSVKGYNLFEDPAIEDQMKDSLRNGEPVRYEKKVNTGERLKELGVREPGKKRTAYLRVLMTPLSSEEGLPPAGYLVQGQDITDQKWAEVEISRLSRRVVEEYEEARRKIAIDLHDEFGQSITALKIEVDMLTKEAGDRLLGQADRLEGMVALLEDTLDKIRSISGELRPILLDDFGLEKALVLYVGEFSKKTGITASADCAGVPADLGKNLELSLFRIAQEALVNIARHAGATRVRVSLLCEDGPIILTVTDNGQGFEIDEALRDDSIHSPFGIMGMRERASLVGGEFSMSSKKGKGTTVVVKVPLESQAR